MGQAIWIACSTFIICGATLIPQEDDLATSRAPSRFLLPGEPPANAGPMMWNLDRGVWKPVYTFLELKQGSGTHGNPHPDHVAQGCEIEHGQTGRGSGQAPDGP